MSRYEWRRRDGSGGPGHVRKAAGTERPKDRAWRAFMEHAVICGECRTSDEAVCEEAAQLRQAWRRLR